MERETGGSQICSEADTHARIVGTLADHPSPNGLGVDLDAIVKGVRSDLEDVAGRAKESGADLVVTTEKDGVKIAGIEAAHELFVLEIGVAFPDGEDRFWDLVFSGR